MLNALWQKAHYRPAVAAWNAEETLAPGQAIVIEKRDGKVFELKRIDAGAKSINAKLDRLLKEMPPEGRREKTDLARVIIEDRK